MISIIQRISLSFALTIMLSTCSEYRVDKVKCVDSFKKEYCGEVEMIKVDGEWMRNGLFVYQDGSGRNDSCFFQKGEEVFCIHSIGAKTISKFKRNSFSFSIIEEMGTDSLSLNVNKKGVRGYFDINIYRDSINSELKLRTFKSVNNVF